MAHQTGAASKLALGLEATYGTAAATGYLLPFVSAQFGLDRQLNNSAVLDGNKNPNLPFLGNKNVAGSIVVPMDAEALWFWLKAMFSTDTQTFPDPTYQHVFKSGESDQTSMTLQKYFTELGTAKYSEAVGCKISQWAFDWGGGDAELLSNFTIVGQDETMESAPFDGSATTVNETTKFYATQAAIQEGGSAAGELTGFSLNYDFGLDTNDFRINDAGKRASISQGKASITGNIKGIFTDTDIVDKAIAGTESSLQITFTSGVYSLQFVMAEVLFNPKTPFIEGPDGIMIDYNYICYLDDDVGSRALYIKLVNATDRSAVAAD